MLRQMIVKDMKVILRDKKILLIILLMPLVLMTILGMAFSSGGESDSYRFERKIAIVKAYDLEEEQQALKDYMAQNFQVKLEKIEPDMEAILFESFLGDEQLKEMITYEILSQDEAMKKLKSEELDALVILPKNFIFDSGINMMTPFRNPVKIQVINGEEMQMTGQILSGIFQSFLDQFNQMAIGKNLVAESVLQTGGSQTIYSEIPKIIETLKKESLHQWQIEEGSFSGRKAISGQLYYAISMMSMFFLFVASNASKIFIMEKEDYTLNRTLISGVGYGKMLASKFLTIVLLGWMQSLVMILYSTLVLKVYWGNPLEVGLAMLLTALGVGAFGTFLGTLSFRNGNERLTAFLESFLFQVMSLLGGNYFFFGNLPDAINKLGLLTFNGLALRLYLGIAVGEEADMLIFYGLGIGLMSIVFLLLSRWMMGKGDGGNA